MRKYLIIGAGGTGGALGAYLMRGGLDVTFIARGEHLEAMRRNGLQVIRPRDSFTLKPVKAFTMQEYSEKMGWNTNGTAEGHAEHANDISEDQAEHANDISEGHAEHPDVIFVCVKGYSLDALYPFLRMAAGKDTVIIPILNIYGTGAVMQKEIPGVLVTDGCIYVASQRLKPGVILMSGDILRVVFGVRRQEEYRAVLTEIAKDLALCGIGGGLSENIQLDALMKYSYVSAQGACGLFFNVSAGEIQKEGPCRDFYRELVHEIDLLAQAQGIHFTEDIVKRNLKILDSLSPDMTTSLQKDIAAGKSSEIDGLIFEVVRNARRLKVDVPAYEKVASKLSESLNR
ncbi:MAG: ketopantoate reductase family protein [Bilifractor sp.]|jgi:2-dehydropantoate 2-reductase